MRTRKLYRFLVSTSKLGGVVSLVLFLNLDVVAQNRPLRVVLRELEQRFSVSFTYSDQNVESVAVQIPERQEDLNEILESISKQSGLVFTRLDNRFITVSKASESREQLVCGILADEESGEKIQGVLVRSGKLATFTDARGYFELKGVRTNDSLIVQSLGYERTFYSVNSLLNKPCSVIRLKMSSSFLKEVIITNYLTAGISRNADGSFVIMTRELGMLPGLTEPDVLFTIQSLPGIQSVDETVSNINVRGGTHDQNLVLWDGMRMYQQGHFFGLISAFNPYLTHEVRLIKNGTPVKFNEGVSSTIDIRSDDQVSRTFSGTAGLNMISGDALAKIPISKNSSLHLSASRSIADLIKTPTYNSYYDRAFRGTDVTASNRDTLSADESFRFFDVSGKFLYDISHKDKLRISFIGIKNKIGYEETGELNNEQTIRRSGLEQENMAGGVNYSRNWSSKVKSSAQWYLSRYRLNSTNNEITNDQRLIQQNGVLDMGVKLDTRFTVGKLAEVLIGYQFFEVGVTNLEDINNPSFYRRRKTVLDTHALLAEFTLVSANGKTTLNAGARTNYFERFSKWRIEPRLSLNQKINPDLSVELLGELKSQTTTQVIDFQNDFLGIEKRRWVMTNDEDIPIVTSRQASIGLHYAPGDFIFSVEGYGKWVDHIVTSSQGFLNQFQFVRATGGYQSLGVDLLVNKRFRWINTWASYALSRNTYTFEGLVPPDFPSNLDIRHRATAGLSYKSEHLEISAGLNWRTGKPLTRPVTMNPEDGVITYETPNADRLSDYWRVDLSASYKFSLSPKVRATAGVSVWNILNHKNVVDGFYQLNASDDVIFVERKALAFTPNATFRVEF